MRKKISKTMMFSMIGVLAIVFLAPLSFAGAQYMNNQTPTDESLPGGVYKIYDSPGEFTDLHKMAMSSAGAAKVAIYHNSTMTPQTPVYGSDGHVNQMLLAYPGYDATKGQILMLQLNMTVAEAKRHAVNAIDLKVSLDGDLVGNYTVPNASGDYYERTSSSAYSSFMALNDASATVALMPGLAGTVITNVTGYADGDVVTVRYEIDESYLLQASLDHPEDETSLVIALNLPRGVNWSGNVMDFEIVAYSSAVSPYTLMDNVAMLLGGLFIVGAVFATPFVSTKGVRRR